MTIAVGVPEIGIPQAQNRQFPRFAGTLRAGAAYRHRVHRVQAPWDAKLAQLDLDWVVLRPSIVYSPDGSYGGTSLLRAMAAPAL